jgi:hypothetical protein
MRKTNPASSSMSTEEKVLIGLGLLGVAGVAYVLWTKSNSSSSTTSGPFSTQLGTSSQNSTVLGPANPGSVLGPSVQGQSADSVYGS